ncbi:MAG: type II toxin-antitoxin system HicB family antitoxin [Lachnospiraceae bacterium]|nr:type II toxin-antitoxin system HicB family antitoxin [Lachnospiraceae bacterium]
MEKVFYPAVFHRTEEGGFWVSFPDFPECFTQGENMAQAYEMTKEALGLVLVDYEKEGQDIPVASEFDKIEIKESDRLVIVEFDMLEYKRKMNAKAVKKTLTIPSWLNEEAMKKGINFSQVLQEALMQKLCI